MITVVKNKNLAKHFDAINNFLTIKNVVKRQDNSLKLDFSLKYNFNIRAAYAAGANSIRIRLLDSYQDEVNLKNNSKNLFPTADNISFFFEKKQKTDSISQLNSVVLEKNFSILDIIDNTQLENLKQGKGVNKSVININSKKVSDLKENFQSQPIMSNAITDEQRNFKLQNILFSGIDPSDVLYADNIFTPGIKNFLGMPRTSWQEMPVSEDLYAYAKSFVLKNGNKISSNDLNDDRLVQTYNTKVTETDIIQVEQDLSITIKNYNQLTNLLFKAQLTSLNAGGDELSTAFLNLSLKSELNYFNSPKSPPIISYTRNNQKIFFNIHTMDHTIKGVDVYRKKIKNSSYIMDAKYSFINSYDMGDSGDIDIVINDSGFYDEDAKGLTTIYKFVVYGKDVDGSRINSSFFKNIVILNHQSQQNFYIPFYCESTQQGVTINVLKNPSNGIIQILRRDLEKVGDSYVYIENSTLDSSAIAGRLYEYKLDISYIDGSAAESNKFVIRHIPPLRSENANLLSVTEPVIGINPQNVTFNMSFNYQKTQTDITKGILSNRGITQFDEYLQQSKKDLGDVTAFQVSRINLATGDIDTFGITDEQIFSDAEASKRDNISELKLNNSYRYEVRAFLRDSTTILKDFEMHVTGTNEKIYKFKPQIFLNPYTLNVGTLLDDNNNNSLITSKNFMELGDVGIFKRFNVVVGSQGNEIKIKDFSIKGVKNNVDLISWTCDNPQMVDHFIVIRNFGEQSYIDAVVTPTDGEVVFYNTISNEDFIFERRYEIYAMDINYRLMKVL